MRSHSVLVRSAALILTITALWVSFPSRFASGAAASTPELARGEHIARLICSACHVVAVDQEFPPLLNQPTPSFAQIANRPETTAQSLQRFVTTTHWNAGELPLTMPNPMISKADAQAVARYIVSLRTR